MFTQIGTRRPMPGLSRTFSLYAIEVRFRLDRRQSGHYVSMLASLSAKSLHRAPSNVSRRPIRAGS
jgi:hypothetical protein